AGLLDLLQRRLGKMMGFDRDLAGQYPRAQDLETVVQLVDHSRRQQAIGIKRVAFQLLEAPQIDDGELLLENVGKSALGKPAMQGHLAAFKSAFLAETGACV